MMRAYTQSRQAVLNHACITVVCTLGFLCSLSLNHLFRQALKMIIKHYELVCNLLLKCITRQVCLRIKQKGKTCNKRCHRLFSIFIFLLIFAWGKGCILRQKLKVGRANNNALKYSTGQK